LWVRQPVAVCLQIPDRCNWPESGKFGWFEGQRIAAEFGAPVYQNLDGPQLQTDWTVTVGWQLAL